MKFLTLFFIALFYGVQSTIFLKLKGADYEMPCNVKDSEIWLHRNKKITYRWFNVHGGLSAMGTDIMLDIKTYDRSNAIFIDLKTSKIVILNPELFKALIFVPTIGRGPIQVLVYPNDHIPLVRTLIPSFIKNNDEDSMILKVKLSQLEIFKQTRISHNKFFKPRNHSHMGNPKYNNLQNMYYEEEDYYFTLEVSSSLITELILDKFKEFSNNIPNQLQEYFVGSVAGQHFNENFSKKGVVSSTQDHLSEVVISLPEHIDCFMTFIQNKEKKIISIYYRDPTSSRWDTSKIMPNNQSFYYSTLYNKISNILSLRLNINKKIQYTLDIRVDRYYKKRDILKKGPLIIYKTYHPFVFYSGINEIETINSLVKTESQDNFQPVANTRDFVLYNKLFSDEKQIYAINFVVTTKMLKTYRFMCNTIEIIGDEILVKLYVLDFNKKYENTPSFKQLGKKSNYDIIPNFLENKQDIYEKYKFRFYYREGLLSSKKLYKDGINFSFAKILKIRFTDTYCKITIDEETKSINIYIQFRYEPQKNPLI